MNPYVVGRRRSRRRPQRPGVEDVCGRRPAAPRGRDRQRHVPEPARRVRVGRADDLRRRLASPSRTCSPLRSSRSGRPLTSSATPLLERDLEDARRGRARSPGRRLMIRPFGWLRQRTCGLRSASSTRLVISRRGIRWPAVDARLHPVELGEHVVGEVEPPVGEDVALDPAQDAERREHLVRGGDLLALAADVVGVEARGRRRRPACGRRSRGTRSRASRAARPISSTLALPSDHVVWQCRSPRMSRQLDERRRRRRGTAPRAAPAGTTGTPSARVDRLLVGRVRQRLERRDVRAASPSRARARSRTAPGSATTSSTGHALDRHARPRAAPSRSITATICGSAAKRASDGRRIRRGADDRQPLAGVAPAPHIAGRLAAERSRDASDELPRRGSAAARAAAAARPRVRAPRAAAPPSSARFPGTARSRPAAAAARSSSAVRTPSARADLDRPLRAEPEIAAEADQLRAPARAPAPPARRSRPSRPARAAAPRSPGRSRAARARGPDRTSSATGTGVVADRLGGAPVRARRVRVRIGELEQRRERVQAVGDLVVLHGR